LVANLPDNEARGTLEVLVGYAVDVAGPDRAAHYLQAVAELASLATDRVSPFVTDMLPKLLSFLDSDNDSLRAVSLSAIEALVRYNTKQALPFVEDTAKKCLELLKYDPFYTYEDSTMDIEGDGQPISAESDDEFEGDDVNNDDEFEDDYAYDDGIDADDTSQKIRLGATKVLEAIVEKAVDICGPIAAEIGVGLTRHLIEHDDSTRMVIFNALTRLLQKANDLVASGSLSKEESQRVVGYWKQHASDVIKGLARSLRLNVKSIQAKQQAFAALSKLLRL
ncbi:SCF complex assembly, partial [Spiromyces aspiralis]